MTYLIQYVVSLLGLGFRVVAAPTLRQGGLLISADDVQEPVIQVLIGREESPGPANVEGDTMRHVSRFWIDIVRKLIGDSSFAAITSDNSVPVSRGKDASDRIDAFHHSSKATSFQNQKRSISRPVYTCPPRYMAVRSSCTREISPQSYTTQCILIGGSVFNDQIRISGSCESNEICVDGVQRPHPDPGELVETAYCVSTENFVRIGTEQTTYKTPSSTIDAGFVAPYRPSTANHHIVEAVVTGLDLHQSVLASTLRIEAQSLKMMSNVRVWQSLIGGTFQCSNCSNLGIFPVPGGTQRIYVTVALPSTIAGGLLYLASVAM